MWNEGLLLRVVLYYWGYCSLVWDEHISLRYKQCYLKIFLLSYWRHLWSWRKIHIVSLADPWECPSNTSIRCCKWQIKPIWVLFVEIRRRIIKIFSSAWMQGPSNQTTVATIWNRETLWSLMVWIVYNAHLCFSRSRDLMYSCYKNLEKECNLA